MITLKENEICPQLKECSFSGIGTDCQCAGACEKRNSKFACDLIDIEPPKVCMFRPRPQQQPQQPQLAPMGI